MVACAGRLGAPHFHIGGCSTTVVHQLVELAVAGSSPVSHPNRMRGFDGFNSRTPPKLASKFSVRILPGI